MMVVMMFLLFLFWLQLFFCYYWCWFPTRFQGQHLPRKSTLTTSKPLKAKVFGMISCSLCWMVGVVDWEIHAMRERYGKKDTVCQEQHVSHVKFTCSLEVILSEIYAFNSLWSHGLIIYNMYVIRIRLHYYVHWALYLFQLSPMPPSWGCSLYHRWRLGWREEILKKARLGVLLVVMALFWAIHFVLMYLDCGNIANSI